MKHWLHVAMQALTTDGKSNTNNTKAKPKPRDVENVAEMPHLDIQIEEPRLRIFEEFTSRKASPSHSVIEIQPEEFNDTEYSDHRDANHSRIPDDIFAMKSDATTNENSSSTPLKRSESDSKYHQNRQPRIPEHAHDRRHNTTVKYRSPSLSQMKESPYDLIFSSTPIHSKVHFSSNKRSSSHGRQKSYSLSHMNTNHQDFPIGSNLHNPGMNSHTTSKQTQSLPRPIPTSKSSTSTIFQNAAKSPITIIVTRPSIDIPPPTSPPAPHITTKLSIRNTFKEIIPLRSGTMTSLPPSKKSQTTTSTLNILNTNFLMPPTSPQTKTQNIRSAQDFPEMRKFLLTFLNTKGDHFSPKLRARLMQLYCITDSDLDPKMFEKLRIERDEGVALSGGDWNEMKDLKALAEAFRRRIPLLGGCVGEEPVLPPTMVGTRRHSRCSPGYLNREAVVRKGPMISSTAVLKSSRGIWEYQTHRNSPRSTSPARTGEENMLRTSTLPNVQNPSHLMRDKNSHYLPKTCSAPNFKKSPVRVAPPVPGRETMGTMAVKKGTARSAGFVRTEEKVEGMRGVKWTWEEGNKYGKAEW